jgi:hypothetical protein
MNHVYIEFDGQQLVVSSDVAEVIEHFRRNYEQMLATHATNPVGELAVMRAAGGYDVRGSIELTHTGALDTLQPYLRREVLLAFVRARPDLLWIHAGAVERNGGAVLISGTSGRGKSTLSTELCHRGWKLLSDENAPIDMTTGQVIPFPQRPRRRLNPGKELTPDEIQSIRFEEIPVDASDVRREPAPVRAIIFPIFQKSSEARLDRLSPGEGAMEIIRNATNFADHKAIAVEEAVRMANGIPCYTLTYDNGSRAAALIDALD